MLFLGFGYFLRFCFFQPLLYLLLLFPWLWLSLALLAISLAFATSCTFTFQGFAASCLSLPSGFASLLALSLLHGFRYLHFHFFLGFASSCTFTSSGFIVSFAFVIFCVLASSLAFTDFCTFATCFVFSSAFFNWCFYLIKNIYISCFPLYSNCSHPSFTCFVDSITSSFSVCQEFLILCLIQNVHLTNLLLHGKYLS